jgi:hypothetical protein
MLTTHTPAPLPGPSSRLIGTPLHQPTHSTIWHTSPRTYTKQWTRAANGTCTGSTSPTQQPHARAASTHSAIALAFHLSTTLAPSLNASPRVSVTSNCASSILLVLASMITFSQVVAMTALPITARDIILCVTGWIDQPSCLWIGQDSSHAQADAWVVRADELHSLCHVQCSHLSVRLCSDSMMCPHLMLFPYSYRWTEPPTLWSVVLYTVLITIQASHTLTLSDLALLQHCLILSITSSYGCTSPTLSFVLEAATSWNGWARGGRPNLARQRAWMFSL